jgi:hypothetical protein
MTQIIIISISPIIPIVFIYCADGCHCERSEAISLPFVFEIATATLGGRGNDSEALLLNAIGISQPVPALRSFLDTGVCRESDAFAL